LRLLCAHHNRLEAERLVGRSGTRCGPTGRHRRGGNANDPAAS
jgi:hypothetical protein